MPRALYGASATGMSPSSLRKLARAVAAAAGGVQHGRCRSTFLALELGASGPEFQAVRRLMETWMMLVTRPHERPETLRRVAGVWPKAVRRLLESPAKGRWRQVKGPMTAVIATLLDYHWEVDPADTFLWRSPCGGDAWHLQLDPAEPTPDIEPFVAAVEESIWAASWQRASQHYLGKGLEDGCDIECLRRYLKKLERNPKGAQWRGSIMTVSTAGFLDSQPAG